MKVGVDEVDVVEVGSLEWSNKVGDKMLEFHESAQKRVAVKEEALKKLTKEIAKEKKWEVTDTDIV